LVSKVDDTGGSISGDVDITSNLLVNDVNVITEIGTKQDEINNYTDISCKTLTTQGIFVNGTCNIDTTIYFDTIVIRAEDPTLSDGII